MNSRTIAINVENISKRYRIGLKEKAHDSLGSAVMDLIKSPLRNYRKYRSLYKFNDTDTSPSFDGDSNPSDIIWALKDVSFQLQQGEVLGIIGKNGAGKSTLLKILSRITTPTSGRVEIRGKVSSLLEVGTGFHQELTGRENVYLNGTILGMTKKEIDLKFDEIVDFSGIEKFIDTPVKRYSSGMKVRLAFSVAAHLEPEILIVDEVLAVGDAEFQRKCLGKMGQVAKEGRTVLLVSHNMGAIAQLCGQAILLEDGQVKLTGSPSDVVRSYLKSGQVTGSTWRNSSTELGGVEVQVKSVRILSEDSVPTRVVEFDRQFMIEISYEIIQPIRDLIIVCQMGDSRGNTLWTSWDTDSTEWNGRVREPGRYLSICKVPGRLFKPERYLLSVGAFINYVKEFGYHKNVLAFDVSVGGYEFSVNRIGLITPVLEWEVKRINGPY
jgi:lipopolysaccharide transport system ATP-binding protein